MQLFSQRQKGQLDVYGLWGVLRGQLLTDDSFVFNKVLKRIKESIEHLSDVSEEDEEALLRVKVHTVPMAVALKICPGMRHICYIASCKQCRHRPCVFLFGSRQGAWHWLLVDA